MLLTNLLMIYVSYHMPVFQHILLEPGRFFFNSSEKMFEFVSNAQGFRGLPPTSDPRFMDEVRRLLREERARKKAKQKLEGQPVEEEKEEEGDENELVDDDEDINDPEGGVNRRDMTAEEML